MMPASGVKNRSIWWVSIFLVAIISFGGGMVTYKYQVFPYRQIKWLAHHLVGCEPGRNHIRTNKNSEVHYFHRKSFFEVSGITAEVVMIGDSITYEAEWHELFPDQMVVNRGIAGDTTQGVLNRKDSILATRAKKAFIMLGHNDFRKYKSETVEHVYQNYKEIVTRLRSNGIVPHIQSTLLAGRQYPALNKKIEALNLRLEALCQKEGLAYINLNRELANDGVLDTSFSIDNVHLNGQGYLVWKNMIKSYME